MTILCPACNKQAVDIDHIVSYSRQVRESTVYDVDPSHIPATINNYTRVCWPCFQKAVGIWPHVGEKAEPVTDRYKGVVVTLSRDIREDDAEATIAAIRQIKGVIDVTPSVANVEDHMNRSRVAYEISDKIWALLKELRA